MTQLPNPIEHALSEATKSVMRMKQRFPAVTFNHDALWTAFDCAKLELARLQKCELQLTEALQKIAAIENQEIGYDWQEIDHAREIAEYALAGKPLPKPYWE